MLNILQETGNQIFFFVLLLLQPTRMKFKQQQKITQFRYKSSTKERLITFQ